MMVRFDEEDPSGAPDSVRDRDAESADLLQIDKSACETDCIFKFSDY
jgi:hypothetical protein